MSRRFYCGKCGVNFDPATGCHECAKRRELAPASGSNPSITNMKDPTNRAYHIHNIPVGDIYLHGAQKDCWCHPTETSTNLWTHNAQDCREARERVTGEQSSEGWILIAEYL